MLKRATTWYGMLWLSAVALGASHAAGQTQETPRPAPAAAPDPAAGARTESPAVADPEDGSVVDGAYVNRYLGLSYALPAEWSQGLEGPPPSATGLYVLAALQGPEGRPSILLTAQDMFFAAKPVASITDMARDLRAALVQSPGMRIDREPAELKVAGRGFIRLDYSALGLHRVWLATAMRCHAVSFNITATDPEMAQSAVRGLEAMSVPPDTDDPAATDRRGSPDPACVKDYAAGANVLQRVGPVAVGPRFVRIPARIFIGVDGRVRHVHIISGFPEQKRAVEDALRQWRLKPYRVNGRPAEVETGLLLEFKSGQ